MLHDGIRPHCKENKKKQKQIIRWLNLRESLTARKGRVDFIFAFDANITIKFSRNSLIY